MAQSSLGGYTETMSNARYPMPLFIFLAVVSFIALLGPEVPEDLLGVLVQKWPALLLLAGHVVLHLTGLRGRGLVYHAVQSATVVVISLLAASASPVITLTAWLCGEAVGTSRERPSRVALTVWHSVVGMSLILLVEGYADALGWILAALPTVVFVIVVVLLYAGETRARESAEELARELADANRRLAAYAIQSTEASRQDERRRMARDLHDTFAQGLSAFILQLQAANAHLREGRVDTTRAILESSMDQARRTLSESRQAITALRSERRFDREQGVFHMVRSLAENLSARYSASVRFSSEVPEELYVTEHALSNLSEIIKEAVHNAAYHGQSEEVLIKLAKGASEHSRLTVQIADSGRGFDQSRVPQEGHYGIAGMKERATEIGASFSISSRPGSGTTVTVELPLAAGVDHG